MNFHAEIKATLAHDAVHSLRFLDVTIYRDQIDDFMGFLSPPIYMSYSIINDLMEFYQEWFTMARAVSTGATLHITGSSLGRFGPYNVCQSISSDRAVLYRSLPRSLKSMWLLSIEVHTRAQME